MAGATRQLCRARARQDGVPVLAPPLRRGARQGVHPDAARPHHLRHDDRPAADAAVPVRLRHQCRPAHTCRRWSELSDNGPLTRAVIAGMQQSGISIFVGQAGSPAGEEALRRGEANFVVVIPQNFERDVVRGLASADPRCGRCLRSLGGRRCGAALERRSSMAPSRETLTGPLAHDGRCAAPFGVIVHRAVQSRGQDLDQYRAGAAGDHPVDDDGDDHGGRHRQGDASAARWRC